jgi:hypothetical protein
VNPEIGKTYLWNNGEVGVNIIATVAGIYSVRAISSCCTSGVSNTVNISTLPTPATPTITASGSTTLSVGGSVTLTASFDEVDYLWSNGATTRAITVSNAGVYSVRAISAECTSAVSASVTVIGGTTAPVTACGAPSLTIDFSRLGSTVCYLSWTANSNATSYRVYWKKVGAASYFNSVEKLPSDLSLKITGLSPNTDYQMYLAVRCASTGLWSNSPIIPFKTKNDLCIAPAISVLAGKNVAMFSGFTFSGISRYDLQWKTPTATTWSAASVSTATHTIANLLASTSYIFRVRAVCTINSDFTAFVYGTINTEAEVSCSAPTPISSTQTANGISVSWSDVGASSYILRWQTAGSSTWKVSAAIAGTSYAITGLGAGLIYNIQLQAKCAPLGEWTAFSTSLNVQTSSSSTCFTPAIDSLKELSGRAVAVYWTATSNVASYEISRRVEGGSTWSVPNVVNGTSGRYNMSYNFFPISSGNNYEVRMRAKCADNGVFVAYQYKTITLGGGAARAGISEAINLSVYPNPSTGTVNISAENLNETAMYYVYNAMGQMVASGEIATETTTLDLGTQANGIYLLKVISNGAVQTKQVSISR